MDLVSETKISKELVQHSHHMCLLPSGPRALMASSSTCFMKRSRASLSSVAGAGSYTTGTAPVEGGAEALAALSMGLTQLAMPTIVSGASWLSSGVSTTTSVMMPSRMRLMVRAALHGISSSVCDSKRL